VVLKELSSTGELGSGAEGSVAAKGVYLPDTQNLQLQRAWPEKDAAENAYRLEDQLVPV